MNNCNHFWWCLQPECETPWIKRALLRCGVFYFAPEQILQLHGVKRWGPIRDMYRNTRKRCPEVDRPLQTGSCLTSLWGFGGGQCVPVGHPFVWRSLHVKRNLYRRPDFCHMTKMYEKIMFRYCISRRTIFSVVNYRCVVILKSHMRLFLESLACKFLFCLFYFSSEVNNQIHFQG